MPDPADSTKTVPDKTKPGFTSPSVDLTTGAPGYILDSEKVALDQAALDAMPAGSYLPGIIKSPMVGAVVTSRLHGSGKTVFGRSNLAVR